jgi:hypothetical protein
MIKITPVGTGVAGEASHICVRTFSGTEIMTAMQNGSGNLELIGWLVQGNQVTRPKGSTATAGTVHEVALALVGRTVVTAVRSGSNRLLLISWNAPSNFPSITRLHDSGNAAGEASQIAMAALEGNTLVTALRAGNGHLLLISWALNPDGSFTRLGDSASQAGAVSLVTIAYIGNRIVVTAVRNGSGNLELIAWRVSPDGKTIHRQDPGGTSAGAVSEISLIPMRTPEAGAPGVITAVRNGSGNLEGIAWRVLNLGTAIERIGDTSTLPHGQVPGTASHIGIGPAGSATTYVASMRRGSGDLELIAFDVADNGRWTREGEFVQGSGNDITETAIASLNTRAVTATRRANFLNVEVWDVSLTSVIDTAGVAAVEGAHGAAAAVKEAPSPALKHAPNTAALNHWFASALADPARKRALREDWMTLLRKELPVSDSQKEHLSLVPAADAAELQRAMAMVVDHGGTIHIERESERSPGTVVVQPNTNPGTAKFSVGIFHCTFDANCRNWHCGWGPARKK